MTTEPRLPWTSGTPAPLLEARGLVTTYPGFVLGPVDLGLPSGELMSLIGTNGSGKSTLIRSLLGLQATAAGTVSLDGRSLTERPPELLARIGYVSDSAADVLSEFTALEYWRYCLLAWKQAGREGLDGALDRAVEMARLLDFPVEQRRPLKALSLGTTRKAQIITALMTSPDLVVLDEPFIGLDFIASRALESLLTGVRDAGTTVLASSQDLDLAARMADRMTVLHRGRLVLGGTVEELGGYANLEQAVIESLDRDRQELEDLRPGGRS